MESIFKTKDYRRFFHAYLETALWSSGIDGDIKWSWEASEIMDARARSYHQRVMVYVKADGQATPHEGDHFGQLGRDFWLDQNGHGSGAEEGHWPWYGDVFARIAQHYPEISLYADERGIIRIE